MADRRAYASATTVRREQSHRRAILLGVAVLLVATMSPLFGHHLPIGTESLLAGRDHIWSICLVALHAILGPVHTVFHVLFFAGLAYAVADRMRASRALRRTLSRMAAVPPEPGSAIWRAAMASGVDAARVRVVPGLPTPAFTAGWLRPRIYLAATLRDHLSGDELAAVLAHEGAHVERRDPLRLSLLRFLGCTLFWLPALRNLAEDIADEREVLADDHAARRHGLALASALVRLAAWEPPRGRPVGVGFNGRDLLERRILRLAGEDAPPRSRVTRRSLAGASLALILAWISGAVVVHPFPCEEGVHETHCVEERRPALSHLFCLSTWRFGEEYCPHVTGRH